MAGKEREKKEKIRKEKKETMKREKSGSEWLFSLAWVLYFRSQLEKKLNKLVPLPCS